MGGGEGIEWETKRLRVGVPGKGRRGEDEELFSWHWRRGRIESGCIFWDSLAVWGNQKNQYGWGSWLTIWSNPR